MNYYKKQLDRVQTDGEFAPPFKVGDSKWMDLNKESAQALREWLDERFPKPEVFINLEDVPDKKSEL